jgi:phenylacetate-CoA ligase
MDIRYWNREIETIDKKALEKYQFENLRKTVYYALQTPFYKERLKSAGITSADDIKKLSDINKIPYTTKDDLRSAYPYNLLAVPLDDVVRLHASSGTTGTATVIYHTQQDIDNWTELAARAVTMIGCTKKDIFQNMMTYGLFTGGLGLHYGAEKAGLVVIPSSSGNTKRQFKFMKDFQTTFVHATPNYLLHMSGKIEEEGYKLSDFNLKKALGGAEPHSEDLRKKIENIYKIDVYNNYGLSEMNGPCVATECVYKNDMHIWEDSFYIEIINPDTLEKLPDGETGEIVFTTLKREATPLLRYRTRDLSSVNSQPCKCGRTHRRITRIKGRSDDMLIINGVNVFPSQIEEILMRMPEIGTNYLILIEKAGALDKITVKTEVGSSIFSDDARDLNALKEKIRENIKSEVLVNPVVELHEQGILPVSEGKAKRVVDNRIIN